MSTKTLIFTRAGLAIAGIAALVAGATYAVGLTSTTAALKNNTITTSAGLQVSTDGSTFASSETGFNFSGMIPGGAASPNQTFFLKNTGSTAVSLVASIPTLPTFTVVPNTVTVANAHVFVNVTCTSTASGNFSLTSGNDLTSLGATNGVAVSGGPLGVGDIATCSGNVSMDGSALSATASSVSSNKFDLNFSGVN